MVAQTTSNRQLLQRALESRNWKTVHRIMSSLPARLPKNCDPPTITMALEEARAAADALIQASDFATSFESSFSTRKALISTPSVLSWATESLNGFSFDQRIIGRIATVLGLLGMGSDGRAAVGCAGAVDQLTLVWSSHPNSVNIVRALVSLCSGHIDNISRTMRRRGISVAVHVLSDQNNREDTSLMEQTLIYIGLCAICTPDTTREEHAVVPTLLSLLEDELNFRRPRLLRHVLMALGNIMDCWTKEGFGYHLGDEKRLVDAILKAWGSLRRSKDIAKSSSWALGSMLVGEGTQRLALQSRLDEVKALAEPWKAEFKTCAFLYETAHKANQNHSPQLNEQADHLMNVATLAEDDSKLVGSSHEYCENRVVNTRLNIAKRERGRGSLRCERLPECKAEKSTGFSSSVESPTSGKECEVDKSPACIRRVSCDTFSFASHADHCGGKRLSKKTRKRCEDHSAKLTVKSAPVRQSKRRRTLSMKSLHMDSGRNCSSSRRARRIAIEVIEISSDSDDEYRSPNVVQSTASALERTGARMI